MIRLLNAIGAALLIVVSFGLYNGVYSAKAHERDLEALKIDIAKEAEAIRVLKAEWSYLNQPERLQELARKHLALAPTAASKIIVLASLPVRGDQFIMPPQVLDISDLPLRTVPDAPLPRPKPAAPENER